MKELRIAFIGAGGVNFGGAEGPWDHASRLEQIGGVKVCGVADPDTEKARRQLAARESAMYEQASVFADYRRMLHEVDLDAVWIGLPPSVHGTTEEDRDVEVECARAGVDIFVEKPLSTAPTTEVSRVADIIGEQNVLVSVGYMFRYSRAVERMREVIQSVAGGARAFVGTYKCAYSNIHKRSWWDMRSSGGPIVEQATHFVDVARYLLGEVESETISGAAVGADEPKGILSDIPQLPEGGNIDRDVPTEFRIPRAVTAGWKFESGAIGSLTHGVVLHGDKYESALEVWGDGVSLRLDDPYGRCSLAMRLPGEEETHVQQFADDPYLAEDQAFVEAVKTRNTDLIRSDYQDALRTYRLTGQITKAVGVRTAVVDG